MIPYGEDLAYIHDAGFSDYALAAAPGLLRLMRQNRVTGGLVVDLGCGSGRWAGELNRNGYDVAGIDSSTALLDLARKLAPKSRFIAGSLWNEVLPRCDAITCIGECVNYESGVRNQPALLFARVHAALRPGGVFLFDAAGPSRIPADGRRRTWTEGRGWAVLVETGGDPKRGVLTRQIVCFRKVRNSYRRSEELHRLRVYAPEDLLASLERAGFRAKGVDRFGRFRLPEGIHGFVAVR